MRYSDENLKIVLSPEFDEILTGAYLQGIYGLTCEELNILFNIAKEVYKQGGKHGRKQSKDN